MTATLTETALLRAICEEPHEDLHRLVYADWLVQECDPPQTDRSEFIRVQCRIAALQATCSCGGCVRLRGGGQHTNGPCAVDRERDELPDGGSRQAFLRRRERELLEAHREEWFPWWGKIYAELESRWHGLSDPAEFRRGCVAEVVCTLAAWLAHGATIVACCPVEGLTFVDVVADHFEREPGFAPWTVALQTGRQSDWPPFDPGSWHETAEEAVETFSWLALNWSRSQVTPPLPPLPR